MKMLDVALAGIDEIGESLTQAINSLKLVKELIMEVNNNENYKLGKNKSTEETK